MDARKIRPAGAARVFGWALLLCAAVALIADAVLWLQTGAWQPETLGGVWARYDIAGLNLVQAGVQRHVAPWLWDDALLPALIAPAWLALGLPGAVLAALFRRRRR